MTNKTTITARAVPIDSRSNYIEEHELKLHLWQQHEWEACFKMDKRDALDLYAKLGEALDIDKQEDAVIKTDKEAEKLVMQLRKEIVGALVEVFEGARDFYRATQRAPEIINALESASLLEIARACHPYRVNKGPNVMHEEPKDTLTQALEELTTETTRLFQDFRKFVDAVDSGSRIDRDKVMSECRKREHEVKQRITQKYPKYQANKPLALSEEQLERVRTMFLNVWPEVSLYETTKKEDPTYRFTGVDPTQCTLYATRDSDSQAYVDLWSEEPCIELFEEKSVWLADKGGTHLATLSADECIRLLGFSPGTSTIIKCEHTTYSLSSRRVDTEDVEEERLEEDALMANLPPRKDKS